MRRTLFQCSSLIFHTVYQLLFQIVTNGDLYFYVLKLWSRLTFLIPCFDRKVQNHLFVYVNGLKWMLYILLITKYNKRFSIDLSIRFLLE